ncbi:unnamed protein product [Cylicocyclus nassatus]|uniref:Uncharacterized protein n=1 Tax=Cylicocyclus nassatus TaxID=53992 RepID=A0AA36MCB4_CYLNA|nr:unnamed protein product [Cylicocyclus nassatus]
MSSGRGRVITSSPPKVEQRPTKTTSSRNVTDDNETLLYWKSNINTISSMPRCQGERTKDYISD